MTSSEAYTLYLAPEFARNVKRSGKAYPNASQRSDFQSAVQKVLEEILASPLALLTTGAVGVMQWRGQEPSPGFFDTQAGSLFFKAYFPVPHVRGAAGQGRIMYMVHPASRSIDILMYYTHAEFSGRPPDRYLKDVFREAEVPRSTAREIPGT